MDFEKIAEASHQAWFVAMAKQGWIFGPRLNPDFKTHPWLKPYGGLSDGTKEIVSDIDQGIVASDVETNPRFGPLAFKSLEDWMAGKPVPQKQIMDDALFDKTNAKASLAAGKVY